MLAKYLACSEGLESRPHEDRYTVLTWYFALCTSCCYQSRNVGLHSARLALRNFENDTGHIYTLSIKTPKTSPWLVEEERTGLILKVQPPAKPRYIFPSEETPKRQAELTFRRRESPSRS
jgi:hypothetical protein